MVGGDEQSGRAYWWAAGGSESADLPGTFPVIRWDLRTNVLTRFPGFALGSSGAVNAQGGLAGTQGEDAAIAFGDGILKLPRPDGTVGSEGNSAEATSDDGRVVAGNMDLADGTIVPVRWTCQ